MGPCLNLNLCARIFVLPCSVRPSNFYPFLQLFSNWGGTICCARWAQTFVSLGISEMIFDSKSKIFPRLNWSWAEVFFCLNNYQVRGALYESNCPALIQKENLRDRVKLELRFQGLEKCTKSSLECDWNSPIPRFPFWPNVYFWIGKRHQILAACKYAPNMKVFL